MHQIRRMMSALPPASPRLRKLWITFQNNLLASCKNFVYFHIFCFFLVFKHDFIRCVDFTHIAASNTASDDVTSFVTHRIFNTDLVYSCAHFVIEIDEKSIHNGVFQYDLITISHSGLLFWATLYCFTRGLLFYSGWPQLRRFGYGNMLPVGSLHNSQDTFLWRISHRKKCENPVCCTEFYLMRLTTIATINERNNA